MRLEKLSKEAVEVESEYYEETVFSIRNDTGYGKMTNVEVIPGIMLIFNDFHMDDCKSSFYYYPDMICIDHCLKGCIDMELANDRHYFLEANDMHVGVLTNHADQVIFPLKHYQGLSIGIAVKEASGAIKQAYPDFPVDLASLFNKIKKYEKFYVYNMVHSINYDFWGFYCISEQKKKWYYRIKILELLIFLDTLDIPADCMINNYFYKPQVQKIKAIAVFLKENSQNNYSAKELAVQFELPVSTMKKCFKSVYGKPIYTFIKEYKMNSAAVELCYSDVRISRLASRFGYDNASKFSAAFKSVLGIPPSAYRRKYKDQEL